MRKIKIHEYQAKDLLRQYQIAVPEGKVVWSAEETAAEAQVLGSNIVLKAQIHAGGRGRAGGVKLCKFPGEARKFAQTMLGTSLVTHQTGPEGKVVRKLLVEVACQVEKEYYLSLAIDSKASRLLLIASRDGGTEIEEVASSSPEMIVREYIDPLIGLRNYQLQNVAFKIQLPQFYVDDFIKVGQGLYRLFLEKDCSLIEINPFVITADRKLLALDAKITFDDNGLFRHPDILALKDLEEEDPREAMASLYNLNYISMNGNIGCLANGAGLSMATMDMVECYGGKLANFLDIGGSVTVEKVDYAFRVILSDTRVKGILVNIFGGSSLCDVIAEGIVEASRKMSLTIPVVVRFEGTHKEKAGEIIARSGLNLIPSNSMTDAVQKIITIINK